jgi:hypothetical protein
LILAGFALCAAVRFQKSDKKEGEMKCAQLRYCVPVMIMLKLKLVMLPALDDAVNVSTAETEVLAFNT